jgi:flagellar motor switch protein FliM
MEKRGLTLDDVAKFEVGQVITLPTTLSSLIRLESADETLFWCTLGQKDGLYTVRIEDFVDDKQEFIQKILGE